MIESFITHPILMQFHEKISKNCENFKKTKKDKCFVAILPVFTEKIYKIKNASRYEAGKFKAS